MSSPLLWNSNNPKKEKQFQKKNILFPSQQPAWPFKQNCCVLTGFPLPSQFTEPNTDSNFLSLWGVYWALATALLLEFHVVTEGLSPKLPQAWLCVRWWGCCGPEGNGLPFPPQVTAGLAFHPKQAIPRLEQVFVGLAASSDALHTLRVSSNSLDDTSRNSWGSLAWNSLLW